MTTTLTRSIPVIGFALALTMGAAQPQAGLPQRVLRPHAWVRSISFSPDSTMLAGGDDQGVVLVWDVRAGHVLRTIHETSPVEAVAFSPAGGVLAVSTITKDRALKFWEPRTGRLVRVFPTPHIVDRIAFSPDGRLLAAGTDDRQIMLWDTRTGAVLRTLGGRTYAIGGAIAFSPDGRLLAVGSPGDGEEGIKLWDVASGQLVRHLIGNHWVGALAYSSDGRVIAGWGTYRQIDVVSAVTLWDPRNGGEYGQLPATDPSWPLAFAPDGRILAVTEHQEGGPADRVRFWDVRAFRWTASLSVPPDPTGYQTLNALSFSPDGHLLAGVVIVPATVVLWDVRSILRRSAR